MNNKDEELKQINEKIEYWLNYQKKEDEDIDIFDILDTLYKQKYDVLYGQHTAEIKEISNKIKSLEVLKDPYKKEELRSLRLKLSHLIELDKKPVEDYPGIKM